jgi:hypothetical protein
MSSRSQMQRAWDAEFEDNLDPQLEAEILAYSQRRYDDSSLNNSQNQEVLAEQKELSAEMSKPYRWRKQEELADHPSRMGHILGAGEFLNLLRNKCKLNCWYTEASFGYLALVIVNKQGIARAEVGVQPGAMPEFSICRFDQQGLIVNEKHRGWRTVLMKLIMKEILTEEQVKEAFGYPEGPAGRRYREGLYAWRNRPRES